MSTQPDERIPDDWTVDYVAYLRFRRNGGLLQLCDSDDEGAFKVYRAPLEQQAELRAAAQEAIEALDSLWAAIGDALCSGTGIEKAYAQKVAGEVENAKQRLRAALDTTPSLQMTRLHEAANEKNPAGIRYVDGLFDWLDDLADGTFDASINAKQAAIYVDYVRALRATLGKT